MGYFRKNIEGLEGYVPGFQPSETGVIKINTNENPYPPSPSVMKALRNISEEDLRRYPEPLADTFREAAAGVLGIGPGNIICTNGGDDLLTICFRAFCDGQSAAAYPVQTYSLYPVLARLQDCKVIEVPFDEEFSLPEGLADTGAALTIVCNPNAPSGSFINVDKLGALAGKLSGVLLIDEAYVDFAKDNCIRLIEDFDNVIILRSMSKGYSLAGLRFGFGIGREELIAGLMKVKDSYNVDAVALAAATAAIKDQEYFRSNIEKIVSERTRLTGELGKLGFGVPDSETNFVMAQCNQCDAGQIYEKLAQRNIYVRYWDSSHLKDKLRITIGTVEQNDKLIEALKEIMPQ